MNYFFYKLDINKYVYSLDMIRINFELNESIIDINDKFYNFLHEFSYTGSCELKTFFSKSYGYRYLYNFIIDSTDEKCSFVIGLCLGSKAENKNKGFIEFNPNKCFDSNIFLYFYKKFKNLCYSFILKRYDLAIDIPVNRKFIKMIRNLKSNYEFKYFDNNGCSLNSSFTEYQGIRNHNKFTKLYDKTVESNLDYDLTRIEFTFDRDEKDFNNLARFILIKDVNSQLSCNNIVFLNLLLTSEDFNYYYKLLSYRKRKSLEPFLNDYYINFNLDFFKQIRDYALSFEF